MGSWRWPRGIGTCTFSGSATFCRDVYEKKRLQLDSSIREGAVPDSLSSLYCMSELLCCKDEVDQSLLTASDAALRDAFDVFYLTFVSDCRYLDH